jgi:DNA-binding response OmpR family regulator
MSPKSILVIEDEAGIALICQRVLNAEGYTVDIAANCKIAWGTLGKKEYDLYIVDIRTPEMNGIELYRDMSERFPELTDRMVFTTGDTMSENTKRFLEQTRKPFLPKPFTPEDLRKLVKSLLT